MGRRSNFKDNPDEQHRFGNFSRRLRQTMGSELEPEQVTPNTGGPEELPEYEQIFPLTRQFSQTNMHGSRNLMHSSDEQRQAKDRHRRRSGSDEDDRT